MLSTTKDPQERLTKIQEICRRRLAQPSSSVHRMATACANIPEALQPHHGYHQICYQRFTANLDRLKDTPEDPVRSISRSSRRSSSHCVIFQPDCIFCNSVNRKKVKVKGCWTTEGMSVFDKDGGATVLNVAEIKRDEKLLTRIRGHDLFACEAKFHESCRMGYVQDPAKWRSKW